MVTPVHGPLVIQSLRRDFNSMSEFCLKNPQGLDVGSIFFGGEFERLTAQVRFWVQPRAFVQNTTCAGLEFISRSRFSNSQNHLKSGTWAEV